MAVLARVGKNKRRLSEVFGIEIPDPLDKDCKKKYHRVGASHYVLLATLALYSVSTLYIQEREDLVLSRQDYSLFPMTISDWSGNKTYLEKNILDSLKADDYLLADYRNSSGDLVNFYVAYYASQQAGAAAHSPRACIPGGGWKINDLRTVKIDGVSMFGKPVYVNRLLIKKGDYGQLVYYWFQQRDRVVTNEYLVKWYLFWDALTRNRTDGSLIRLTTAVSPGDDMNKADARLISFLKKVNPVVINFMPE
jgi:EpsI family protein